MVAVKVHASNVLLGYCMLITKPPFRFLVIALVATAYA